MFTNDFNAVLACSGYMSPEYAMSGHFSVKSDVFSFGVLVLEIVSGKKNWGFYHPEHDLNLIGYVSVQELPFDANISIVWYQIIT